ncbi:MAG TPA: Os1348 family NHLP clan protein [Candidatus Methylomirabilis sp.]|nr:Os1348 family NHLP clan protein [Candidatus Methylomirabilis sp.]
MSQREVERALGRLVTDEGFREEFFRGPQSAVLHAGLDLSQEELDALSRTPRAALAALCTCIDGRICRLHIADQLAPEEQRR